LEAERVRAAARTVLSRYPALRLTFPDGVRIVPGAVDVPAPVDVVRLPEGVPDAAARLHELAQRRPMDTACEPLLRLTLAGPLLAVTVHLMVLDGRGLLTLCRAVADACAAEPGSRAAPAVDDGFLRYLTWRDQLAGGARAVAAGERWRNLLGSGTGPVRPEIGPLADRRVWEPDHRLHDVLRSLAAERRVTPFTLHLTAFATAMAWAQGHAEVCPAVPLDGRCHTDLDQSVGGFANVVPVPLRIPGGQRPRDALAAVRDVFDRIREMRTVPFADLAAADPALRPFADLPVVFNYARDEEERPLLGAVRMRSVGPDPLAPGQRVRFSVVDSTTSFRVSLAFAQSALEEQDAQLLTLYQKALYALAFTPDGEEPQGPERPDGDSWHAGIMERI
jgi:hypothetical protein